MTLTCSECIYYLELEEGEGACIRLPPYLVAVEEPVEGFGLVTRERPACAWPRVKPSGGCKEGRRPGQAILKRGKL